MIMGYLLPLKSFQEARVADPSLWTGCDRNDEIKDEWLKNKCQKRCMFVLESIGFYSTTKAPPTSECLV
jgi:hypothetical protein